VSTDASRRPLHASAQPEDETVFGRWSRLKSEARRRARGTSEPAVPPGAVPAVVPAATLVRAPASPDRITGGGTDAPTGATGATAPPAPVLPDLADLDENADYSAFLAEGVDAALRRRALRQLFGSPKFNVCDGLDTYVDDFTSFPSLGTVVTADMRHHLERLAARNVAGEEAAARRWRARPRRCASARRRPPL
jgi:hypothetical protein